MLASAGVLVGFCGGGSTPLFTGCEIEWMTPQSEYRPTEYVQGWLGFWFDEQKRLAVAQNFQHARIDYLQSIWTKDRDLQAEGFHVDDADIATALSKFNELPIFDNHCLRSLPRRQLRKYARKQLN